MKQKTHSGLKKRIKVRKSGTLTVSKSCKRHLLSNKSKGQKAAGKCQKRMEKDSAYCRKTCSMCS